MNKALHFGKLITLNQPMRWLKQHHQWAGENTGKHCQLVAYFHFFVTIIWWREALGFSKKYVKSGYAPPWHPRNGSVHLDNTQRLISMDLCRHREHFAAGGFLWFPALHCLPTVRAQPCGFHWWVTSQKQHLCCSPEKCLTVQGMA